MIDKNEKRLQTDTNTNGNDLEEMSFNADGMMSQSFSRDVVETSNSEKSSEESLKSELELQFKEVISAPLTG